jgi:hypothetical protein
MTIRDPEVRILAGISQALEAEYLSENREWEGSPFAWIKTRPSRQVGAIGEKLLAGWIAARGFNVTRASDSDADRVIEDKRVEIKFSTLRVQIPATPARPTTWPCAWGSLRLTRTAGSFPTTMSSGCGSLSTRYPVSTAAKTESTLLGLIAVRPIPPIGCGVRAGPCRRRLRSYHASQDLGSGSCAKNSDNTKTDQQEDVRACEHVRWALAAATLPGDPRTLREHRRSA